MVRFGPDLNPDGIGGLLVCSIRQESVAAWRLPCCRALVLDVAYSATGERQRLVSTRAGDAGGSAVALSTLAFLKLCAGFSPPLLLFLVGVVSRRQGL